MTTCNKIFDASLPSSLLKYLDLYYNFITNLNAISKVTELVKVTFVSTRIAKNF